MRKVKFKRWIKHEYENSGNGGIKQKEGTGLFEDDYSTEGLFHQWGSSESEIGNAYSVGLVELPDGTIEEVLPINIKFIDSKALFS